jgi:cytochrome c biogenesis protein CcmG, thiol:disulfide interchange protein DsbE
MVAEQRQSACAAKVRKRGFQMKVLGLLCLFAIGVTGCDRGDHPALVGRKAPEFRVSDGRQSVDLAALRGHVVVLNFWATWCLPCIDEVPTLVELQRRMPQITVVAVSSDEDDAAYRQFLAAHSVDFLTVRDPSYRVPHMYGTVKIPETYVIDRNGSVRRKFVSAQDWTSPEIVDYLSRL